MEMAFTSVFRKVPEGYIGFVGELPGANTQGATLDEVTENLREAVELVLETNRALAREVAGEANVIREPIERVRGAGFEPRPSRQRARLSWQRLPLDAAR